MTKHRKLRGVIVTLRGQNEIPVPDWSKQQKYPLGTRCIDAAGLPWVYVKTVGEQDNE